jgi:hypothetical protein
VRVRVGALGVRTHITPTGLDDSATAPAGGGGGAICGSAALTPSDPLCIALKRAVEKHRER